MKKTKLPVAWIIFLAAVCALAATVLQSVRKAEQEFPMAGKNVSQLGIFSDSGKFFVTQRSEWTQQQTQYQLADYLDALKYLPQAEIRARFPDAEGFYVSLTEEGAPEDYEDTLTYRANGAGEISGWQIHLALTPRQEHLQMGEEAASAQEAKTLHLFYENGN